MLVRKRGGLIGIASNIVADCHQVAIYNKYEYFFFFVVLFINSGIDYESYVI